jgi:hypothetical protein
MKIFACNQLIFTFFVICLSRSRWASQKEDVLRKSVSKAGKWVTRTSQLQKIKFNINFKSKQNSNNCWKTLIDLFSKQVSIAAEIGSRANFENQRSRSTMLWDGLLFHLASDLRTAPGQHTRNVQSAIILSIYERNHPQQLRIVANNNEFLKRWSRMRAFLARLVFKTAAEVLS